MGKPTGKTNSDAFKGMTQWNNQRVTMDLGKEGNPTFGESGETIRFTLASGGGLFLRNDQVTLD